MPDECYRDLGAPSLVLMSQSMMWPANHQLLRDLFSRQTHCLFAEVRNTRHQDQSDVVSIAPLLCRVLCMGGMRHPHDALDLNLDVIHQFLRTALAPSARLDASLPCAAACRGADLLVHGVSGMFASPAPLQTVAGGRPLQEMEQAAGKPVSQSNSNA